MTTDAVRYEDFIKGSVRGFWPKFVRTLEVGTPTRVPDMPRNQVNVISAAQRAGLAVVTRKVNGEIWVCLLRPEDVK